MKNLLSYQHGIKFTGREIKEWIQYQIDNKTSHYKEAMHMKKYDNITDDVLYCIDKGRYEASERDFLIIRWNC